MPTVQQVARELGLTSQEVIARLGAMGRPVDGHLSQVDDGAAERLRRESDRNGSRGPAGRRVATITAGTEPAPKAGAHSESETDGSPMKTGTATTTERPTTAGTATSVEPGTKDEPTAASGKDGPAPPPQPATKRKSRKRPKKKRSLLGQVVEVPVLIGIAFVVALVIKIFLVQAFFIPSGSMIPTLHKGDRVLVEKVTYRFSSPDAGDVIVFIKDNQAPGAPEPGLGERASNFFRELLGLPTTTTEDYIKRIVGVGGDVISYDGKPRVLTVNGNEVKEPYIKDGVDRSSTTITSDNCKVLRLAEAPGGCRVPAGSVFVMGDNRSNSQDSRFIGPIDRDKIVGRAFTLIWPFDHWSGL